MGKKFLLGGILFFSAACSSTRNATSKLPGARVKLTTDSGIIILRLYDKTPLHRDNFIKLVKQHYYDSLLFHRVIKNFMIQGGDPESKNAKPGILLGNGGHLTPFRRNLILHYFIKRECLLQREKVIM